MRKGSRGGDQAEGKKASIYQGRGDVEAGRCNGQSPKRRRRLRLEGNGGAECCPWDLRRDSVPARGCGHWNRTRTEQLLPGSSCPRMGREKPRPGEALAAVERGSQREKGQVDWGGGRARGDAPVQGWGRWGWGGTMPSCVAGSRAGRKACSSSKRRNGWSILLGQTVWELGLGKANQRFCWGQRALNWLQLWRETGISSVWRRLSRIMLKESWGCWAG